MHKLCTLCFNPFRNIFLCNSVQNQIWINYFGNFESPYPLSTYVSIFNIHPLPHIWHHMHIIWFLNSCVPLCQSYTHFGRDSPLKTLPINVRQIQSNFDERSFFTMYLSLGKDVVNMLWLSRWWWWWARGCLQIWAVIGWHGSWRLSCLSSHWSAQDYSTGVHRLD